MDVNIQETIDRIDSILADIGNGTIDKRGAGSYGEIGDIGEVGKDLDDLGYSLQRAANFLHNNEEAIIRLYRRINFEDVKKAEEEKESGIDPRRFMIWGVSLHYAVILLSRRHRNNKPLDRRFRNKEGNEIKVLCDVQLTETPIKE